jgi:preprotein translocase subunit SecD
MAQFPRWKIFVIFFICILGIVLAMPNFLSKQTLDKFPEYWPKQTMNLGLDLRGGSHLLLEVDFPYYLAEQLTNLQDGLRKELRLEKIGYLNLKTHNNGISFIVREPDAFEKALKLAQKGKDFIASIDNDKITISYTPEYIKTLKAKLVEQSIEIIRRRVDETGTKEPIIQRQGEDKVLLQVPGLNDPEHLKKLLGQTAKMTFHLVNNKIALGSPIPFDTMLMDTEADEYGNTHKITIYKKIVLNGDLLKSAMVSFDQYSKPVVAFEFNNIGAKQFAEITTKNIGNQLAIVLDNKVICAPSISTPIVGGAGHITGGYTAQTANDLALLLRAGALPAPLKVIEERTVGPSLGAISIAKGSFAALISVLAVIVFMVVMYGVFGIFANIALCFNLIFLVALLSSLQATLTLPGIAGIVLTMGMSVDANVLIFERIREESKNGLAAFSSLDRGFNQAFNTIIDSNLTTILVGIFLYSFGSGAVKGFAVTLVIGIATSMFSAITLTKLMAHKWVHSYRPKSFT